MVFQVRYAFELLPSGLVVGERVLDSVPLLSDVRVFMNDGYPTQAVKRKNEKNESKWTQTIYTIERYVFLSCANHS